MSRLRCNPWIVLIVLCLGFFMILLDATIVNIAIPSIISSFQASLDQLLWVINGYILVYAVLLITFGRLGDILGQRNVYLAGMVIFIVSSAFCGIAQDPNQLILARVFQGIGGAALTPQTLAIITSIFPAQRRGAAFGVWGIVAGVAAIAGPTVGGFLVTNWSWRWIFYVNLPIGVVALAATLFLVPDLRPGRRHGFDLIGVVLASLGLFAIVFGLIEGERYNWGTVWEWLSIPAILVLGALLLVAFFVWERFAAEPLVPLRLVKERNFALMNWAGAVVSFGTFGIFLPATIYFQSVLGMTALEAGLALAPTSLVSMFVAPVAGRLSDKMGGKFILMFGLLMFALGIGLIGWQATPDTQWASLLPALIVTGIGMGCIYAPTAAIAMRNVSPVIAGAASGLLNTTRQLGAVLGSAIVGAVLQNQLSVHLAERATIAAAQLPAQFQQSFILGFSQASQGGMFASAAPTSAQFPASVPPQVVEQVRSLASGVFPNAFVDSMPLTLIVSVCVLVLGALTCLFVVSEKRQAAAHAAASTEPEYQLCAPGIGPGLASTTPTKP